MAVKNDHLRLDDQLCFALYAASRAVTARYRPLLDPLGLTYPQYLVMLVLWEQDQATVQQLGRQLRLDSGTLSPLLKRLEDAGLVTRARRPEDERSVLVRLTARGRRLRTRAAAVPDKMRECLDGVDIDAMTAQLHALTDMLHLSGG
jgi:MarR family transcriptional regulator, organic hydroperoxide resistance regulator